MNYGDLCLKCGLYKQCNRPDIDSYGNRTDPEIVLILPYPENEDDDEKVLSMFKGPRAQFVLNEFKDKMEGDDPTKWKILVTYLVKCTPHAIPDLRSKWRNPSSEEIKCCTEVLKKELKPYGNSIILTFGDIVYNALLSGEKEFLGKITSDVGKEFRPTFNGVTHTIIPNYDPDHINYRPDYASRYFGIINKVRNYHDREDVTSFIKILNPEETIIELDKALKFYYDDIISHIYFDIENSVSLKIQDGGEILSFGFTHDAIPYSFSCPLVINNNVVHEGYEVDPISWQISPKQRLEMIAKMKQVLETIPIVGHHLKYDIKWSIASNMLDLSKVRVHADTIYMAFQLFNKSMPLGLKSLSQHHFCCLNWETDLESYLKKFKSVKDRHYGNVPSGMLNLYACYDIHYTKKLYKLFNDITPSVYKPINTTLCELITPFSEMETKGIKTDDETLQFLRDEYKKVMFNIMTGIYDLSICKNFVIDKSQELTEKERLKCTGPYGLAIKVFNVASTKKLAELLYDSKYYGLPIKNKTDKGNAQTDEKTLLYYYETLLTEDYIMGDPKLVECKEFIKKLFDFKAIDKIIDSYVNPISEESPNGFYYPEFNLIGTTTCRLSSAFHSMPKDNDVKRIFTSRWKPEGGLFLTVDYSQLELRVIAALAKESKFIDSFKRGNDAHTFTASQIYKVPTDQITSKQRAIGKRTNFAVIYGKTAESLADDLKISVQESRTILNDFYSGCSNLRSWQQNSIKFAKEHRYIETNFGRRVPILGWDTGNRNIENEAKRFACNYPIQCTASDIVIHTVKDIYTAMKRENLKSLILATIHDSIEFDIYPGELFKVLNIIKREAIDTIPIKYPWMLCPLDLSYEIGYSWGGSVEIKPTYLDGGNGGVFDISGIKYDFEKFIDTAKKCYNIKLGEIKEEQKETEPSIGFIYRDKTKIESIVRVLTA